MRLDYGLVEPTEKVFLQKVDLDLQQTLWTTYSPSPSTTLFQPASLTPTLSRTKRSAFLILRMVGCRLNAPWWAVLSEVPPPPPPSSQLASISSACHCHCCGYDFFPEGFLFLGVSHKKPNQMVPLTVTALGKTTPIQALMEGESEPGKKELAGCSLSRAAFKPASPAPLPSSQSSRVVAT